jgi:hypothetical protein
VAKSVFLSYSKSDKEFVRVLARDLEAAGVRVWFDEGQIQVGDSLVDKIGQAITEVDFLAVVLSQNSVRSEWVKREVEISLTREFADRNVAVLPILKEDCEVPPFLKGKAYADFRSPAQYTEGMTALLKRLGVTSAVGDHLLSVDPALRDLQSALQGENYRVADAETKGCIHRVLGIEDRPLTAADLAGIDAGALRKIDHLWLRYSQGRFGFSVQARLFKSFVTAEEFADAIGWRRDGVWLIYDDLTFSRSAPEGHLPVGSTDGLIDPNESFGSVGILYSAKESAKYMWTMLTGEGGIRKFMHGIATQSEPYTFSFQWMVGSQHLWRVLAEQSGNH